MIVSVLIFVLIHVSTQTQMLNDYSEITIPESEMIYYPARSFIKLKCDASPCNYGNITFKWEFKACNPDLLDPTNCDNNANKSWVSIFKKSKSEQCSCSYLIKNATGKNSGLYRCSIVIPNSKQMKAIQRFKLHVVERYDIRSGTKPQLIDIQPMNTTIIENSKIVIQCKVYSDYIFPPDIWWLKHVNTATLNDNSVIPYNNKTYLKMNSSQMELNNFVYVSKLIIEKSSENDTGVYTCFAVNIYGMSGKDVYIDVIALQKDWQGTTSFSLLFLIPLCFALIPISGWLCVHYYRKKKLRKLENTISSDFYKYQHVLNRHQNRIFHFPSQRIV